jgi:hypothetical protein
LWFNVHLFLFLFFSVSLWAEWILHSHHFIGN